MIIPCFRCGKQLNSPDASKADYIIAEDTKVTEPRPYLVLYKYNDRSKKKMSNNEAVTIDDFDRVVITDNSDAVDNTGVAIVRDEMVDAVVQKTGIICPDCHKPTDFVIWGVHKEIFILPT